MPKLASITADGVTYRPSALAKPRTLLFDDILKIEGGTLTGRGGESVDAGAEASRISGIVAGPAIARNTEETSKNIASVFGGPHGARRAARMLVEDAAAVGASDVHLEPGPDATAIRLRIDGALREVGTVPRETTARLVAAFKGWAGCLPYRKDIIQEGRIAREGVAADIRASFVPAAFGERVALRLFGRLRRLDELGLDASSSRAFTKLLELKRGLVIVAGGTGAGKTTTLYAALAHLATTRGGAHLSLEDPIEQRLRATGIPVDQVELAPEKGLTGEAMLTAALRQDVDVIAVGEIRTPAEAALAVRAAHTGRLVLAGLHAGSLAEARARLVDLGVEGPLLAAVLRGVVYQELLMADGKRALRATVEAM